MPSKISILAKESFYDLVKNIALKDKGNTEVALRVFWKRKLVEILREKFRLWFPALIFFWNS